MPEPPQHRAGLVTASLQLADGTGASGTECALGTRRRREAGRQAETRGGRGAPVALWRSVLAKWGLCGGFDGQTVSEDTLASNGSGL